ncbi:hypothetical protein [Bacillus dakarensis]|uniref:hypothetical protein n=1 Tax=Robertmurraya dakarensis TaxID=1926278 RepID=UPI000980E7C6|nr:hypothetical protein [Bacillus dakarensis]
MNGEKIEDMLAQLIGMVGGIQAEQHSMKKDQQDLRTSLREMKRDQQEMKQDLQEMKRDQQEMKQDLQEMKRDQQEMKQIQQEMQIKLPEIETKGEERHKEIVDRFKAIENDQDFIWEKTARNEREIGNIKRQLS